MLAQVREHVVQKADATVNLIFTIAVQIKLDRDIRFFGLSVNLCRSCFHENYSCLDKISFNAATSISFCSGVPILILNLSSSRGYGKYLT